MNEPEVVQKVHRFLTTRGFDGGPVSRLYTDAHSTLTGASDLRPFQRFAFDFGDFVVHPDLLGQTSDGESLFAVEAKGEANVLTGLFQAEMYQNGVQQSFLAAPAEALSNSIVQMARAKGIGVLRVREGVETVYVPEPRMPLQRLYRALVQDIESVAFVNESGIFQYNLPTHYLVWATALKPQHEYDLAIARQALGSYPIPDNWLAALRGAQKLGLVQIDGKCVRLTDVGAAVRVVLPADVNQWQLIHERVAARSERITLSVMNPLAGAALRLLLLQDPIVRMVVEGLRRFEGWRATFMALAGQCAQIDHRRASIFFLKPEAAVQRSDARGVVDWSSVVAEDLRSTTFYQYKSILKHAGILAPSRLGGASTKGYDVKKDVWELLSGV